MDNQGNGFAVWMNTSPAIDTIEVRRYVQATDTWEPLETLSDSSQFSSFPFISMDASGNAMAIWQQTTDGFTVIARWYNAVTGMWNPQEVISDDGTRSGFIAMNKAGDAVASMTFFDAGNWIVQGVLFYGLLFAPTDFTACKKNIRFPTQVEVTHSLSWSPVQGATKYNVYLDTGIVRFIDPQKNAFLVISIGEIPVSDSPCIEVHARCPREMTYSVAAVDDQGDEGFSASVTI